ncbi:PE-PPE domain-containing protein [Candidatus Mycobacterium wuenschmannii]|uniref:PE-PPE domain-containing protein n=1 Tax=Candidatus Mycobacterium wuenschmannii TaxID=3027808 RepID=A0ABY8W0A5_9MYCO|nr:PE-PPE domain-containing protein [Candidatus Mycobacterium wuenschmannii]WIM89325.1 PE-PPE domain-containing protein [Candidatus Mycobacterium wuenschmannii]
MSKVCLARAVGVAFAAAAAALCSSSVEARADIDAGAGFLDGSTLAIIMGPTYIPDPTFFPGYIPGAVTEYLQPLGFSDSGTVIPLITEESPNFGPSIASGVDTLVHAIETQYDAGAFSADDPLTVFGYSQSAVVASMAEEELHAYGIPLTDLRFVLIGDAAADPPSGPTGLLDTWGATPFGQWLNDLLGWSNLNGVTTPSDLYPTDVFTVANDFFADTATPADFMADPLGALWHDFIGFFEHGVYLGGLAESEILSVIDAGGIADGATTYFNLADPVDLFKSLFDVTLGSFGIVVP